MEEISSGWNFFSSPEGCGDERNQEPEKAFGTLMGLEIDVGKPW